MRNDPIEDTGNLLIDLWRNTSPIVRVGLFGGLGLGLLAGTYYGLWLGGQFLTRTWPVWEPSFCAFIGCTVAGTTIGLALGVAVELVVDKIRGPQDKKRRRRRRP
jgi:hypothetical protein